MVGRLPNTHSHNTIGKMGDIRQPATEIWQGLGKIATWVILILLSVMAKLAADSRVQRLTKRDIVIKTVLSIFVGVVAAIICESLRTKWGKVIVPVSTLLGESVIVYVMTNWQSFLSKLLPRWFGKDKEGK